MDYGTGKRRPFFAPVGSRDGLILASLSPSAITCGPFLKRKPFQRVANIAGRHILIEHFGAGHGNRYHEPPYTQAEEDEFYRRVGGGPVTVAHKDRKFTLNPISPVQIPAVVQQALHPNNLVCPTALKPAFAERRTCRRRSDQCSTRIMTAPIFATR